MLDVLYDIESRFPSLTRREYVWSSELIDYGHPHIEQFGKQEGDHHIYILRILPCTPEQAFFHPHRWPSAMRICQGTLVMPTGYGSGALKPAVSHTFHLTPGSAYEMNEMNSWHSAYPATDEPVLALKVSGREWKRPMPPRDHRPGTLSRKTQTEMFEFFREYYKK